jgi:hypothetical protein
MSMAHTDFISFYITNVCGLSCVGCASFNNYAVKHHHKWEVARKKTYKWATLLSPRQISIIGGEPLLNPEIDDWVLGIRDAFSHVDDIRVFTGLTSKSLLRYQDSIKLWLEHNVIVQISVHDPSWWETSIETGKEIFKGYDFEIERKIDEGSFPLKAVNFKTPDGKIIFSMLEQWEFFHSAVQEVKDGVMYFHKNNPDEAHKACHCKDCHYVVDGDMYKCVITGTSKMILDQLPIDDHTRSILSQTRGLDPFVDGWDSDIKQVAPQCTLCSTKTQVLIPAFPIPIKKEKIPK